MHEQSSRGSDVAKRGCTCIDDAKKLLRGSIRKNRLIENEVRGNAGSPELSDVVVLIVAILVRRVQRIELRRCINVKPQNKPVRIKYVQIPEARAMMARIA